MNNGSPQQQGVLTLLLSLFVTGTGTTILTVTGTEDYFTGTEDTGIYTRVSSI